MSDSTEAQAGSTETPDEKPLPPASQQHESAAVLARTKAELLLETIQSHTVQVEQIKQSAELAKAEIDAQLSAMKEVVAALGQQVELGRSAASELSTLSTSVHSANDQSKETATQAAAALESARALADAAGKSASLIEGLKTQVEQSAQVAAQRSDHIENGRLHVDSVRASIDRLLNEAQLSTSNAEAQHQASRSAVDNINALYTASQTVKANTDSIAEGVASTRATVEGHAATTKRLAEIAESTQSRIAQYESKLTSSIEESEKQRKIIDELLLGATNAGLASAYDQRSKMFKSPERFWNRVFISSLVGLFGLATWQVIAFGAMAQPPDWQQLLRMLVIKVPFLVPLVWLAIHASRQAAFAKRMEEEYAFKATTSMSFEGYRRQMADVSKDLGPDSPLAQLCSDTLRTIAAPPGQVYDKHRMDPTPGTAAAEIVGPVVDGVSKVIASRLPGPMKN